MQATGQQNNPNLLGNANLNDNRCQLIAFNNIMFLIQCYTSAYESEFGHISTLRSVILNMHQRIGECSSLRRDLRRRISQLEFKKVQLRIKYIYGIFKRKFYRKETIRYKEALQTYINKNKHKWTNGNEEDHKWAMKLFSNQREIKRWQAFLDIFEVMETTGIAEFWNLNDKLKERNSGKKELKEFLNKMNKLSDFVNNTIKNELPLLGKKTIPVF